MTVVHERRTGRRTRRIIVRLEPVPTRCERCLADLEVEAHFADCPEK